MNHSCKCDNCGEPADDECPIDNLRGDGCGWELCNKCIETVLNQEIPRCPKCGNENWPKLQLDQNAGYYKGSDRELTAKKAVEEWDES